MKKLILLELLLLFLATTFHSNPPPGWYQQTLPVNDFVRDIYFLDSLNGWVATISYIIRTSDGGKNWKVADSSNNSYYKLQFLDLNTGYLSGTLGGGGASVWKTTDGGYNWNLKHNFGFGFGIEDLQFLNEDTGWVSSSDFDFGGIWKTTNGGSNWIKQLSPPSTPVLVIKAISILNKDTGWAINNSGTVKELYRTTNGGTNWNKQFTYSGHLNDILFLNKDLGIISGGVNQRTTNGGFNWILSDDGGIKLSFSNDSVGWTGNSFITIQKTINGGVNWFRQTTNTNNPTPFAISTLNSWAGGNKLIHTTDGGGLSSIFENNAVVNYFILSQNYPNPFNPKTNIKYEIRNVNYVLLIIFDIQGKEVTTLVNEKKNTGIYEIEFDGSFLSSGIYFYKIEVSSEKGKEILSETKKMILIR